MEDIKDYKRELLIHEHGVLSGFVEQEVVATALARTLAAAGWLVGMALALSAELGALTILLIAFPGIWAAWLADVYYSYVGVIYKVRRLAVRDMLAKLPQADAQEVGGWATPINPFDGGDKRGALMDSLRSPWILAPYALLELATLLLIFLG